MVGGEVVGNELPSLVIRRVRVVMDSDAAAAAAAASVIPNQKFLFLYNYCPLTN